MDGRCRQTLPALLQNEAADLAFIILGPDHKDIGDGTVGDPGLGPREAVATLDLAGARHHAARIGAMVGLGQAKAADQLARGQLGQILLLLLFGAESLDGHHHQRALHAHHRAVAGIDPLDLAGNQPVTDIVEPGATVFLGDGGAQQAQLTHLAEDAHIGLLMAESLLHTRQQLVLAVGTGTVLHHALGIGKLRIQQQRVSPVEGGAMGSHGSSPFHYSLRAF